MTRSITVSDIVESNGKTVKENNLDRSHKIPVGALVEVKFNKWHGDGACEKIHARLWVVRHTRDCDGEPLYALGRKPPEAWAEAPNELIRRLLCGWEHGFGEESLTIVEVTEELKYGTGALEWEALRAGRQE